MGRFACRETVRVEGGIVSNQTAAATPAAAPLVLVADDEPVIRDLVCDNAIRLHAGMNEKFFSGTAVNTRNDTPITVITASNRRRKK